MLVTAYIILASCTSGKSEEDIARSEVKQFAEAYFNYDLKAASEYCTPESRRWIEYTAANIGDEDVEILRSKQGKAGAIVENIVIDSNDSTGTALVRVNNYLRLGTIGETGTVIDNTSLYIYIVKRNGRWMADLRKAFPQRNGTPGRD